MTRSAPHVVCLSGGVGGARLCHGLARALPPERVTFVVNTGDDFTHLGLVISPDVDTVMYTLADLADVARGWGLAGDSFATLDMVRRYGGESWFQLGDRDLATHLLRSQWLREGLRLGEITARLCAALGVRAPILPMSDEPCATMIDTPEGTLTFQQWLVEKRGAPEVRRVWSASAARPSDDVLAAIEEAALIVIGPSNPYVSIDPILNLPGVRERVAARKVVAVSPIVHGSAVKGPLAGMLRTLAGLEPSAAAVAAHYGALLSGYVVEHGDEHELASSSLRIHSSSTVMTTRGQSLSLARDVLAFAETL